MYRRGTPSRVLAVGGPDTKQQNRITRTNTQSNAVTNDCRVHLVLERVDPLAPHTRTRTSEKRVCMPCCTHGTLSVVRQGPWGWELAPPCPAKRIPPGACSRGVSGARLGHKGRTQQPVPLPTTWSEAPSCLFLSSPQLPSRVLLSSHSPCLQPAFISHFSRSAWGVRSSTSSLPSKIPRQPCKHATALRLSPVASAPFAVASHTSSSPKL